jgi:DNA helicase II / ATP-dependent DNA helicase PcrA
VVRTLTRHSGLATVGGVADMPAIPEPASTPLPPWLEGVRGEQVKSLILSEAQVLRVPAGPGTGKTFGLRKRLLRLLHPDGLGVEPDRVLVCAFNRVIAADLRGEIATELDTHGLGMPQVVTVHGLAASLAGESPRFLLPQEIEAMIYDVRELHPEIDRRFDGRQGSVMRAFKDHEAGLADHPALGSAVRAWLADHGAKLVGDLPRQVANDLRGGMMIQRRYEHIVVDEFQDLTQVEAELILALRASRSNVATLGDQKQSIYAFRGNRAGGMDSLSDLVSDAITDHRMDECWRCRSEVVELANQVMDEYNEPLSAPCGSGGQIHVLHHATPRAEHARIAREIVRVRAERPDDNQLVLVTRRQWGYDLRRAVKALDATLEVQTVFAEDVLQTWPAREAFGLLSIMADREDSAALRDWIGYRSPDANGKNFKAQKRNAPAYLTLRAGSVLTLERALALADGPVTALTGTGRSGVHARLVRLQELIESAPDASDMAAAVRHVLDPDKWVVTGRADEDLAREDIGRLRDEANSLVAAEDGAPGDLMTLVQVLRHRIATREPLGVISEPRVRIVTLWGAKGLTSDIVYVVGLCDEALPGPFDAENSGHDNQGEHKREQQRLLYVSLTRAKKALVISRPNKIKPGQVASLGLARTTNRTQHWQYLRPCQFFADVARGALPDSIDGEEWPGIDLDALPG